ncbi:MAG: polysaccharide deacetylase family protein [Verrucomicrobiota bacterium]
MTVATRHAPPTAIAVRVSAPASFVLSFDFEDWHQLVYRRLGRANWRSGNNAFPRHVHDVLALLDELGVRATFFAVGAAAERHPSALRDVVSAGHEVGCHGYEHLRAFTQTKGAFRDDTLRCLDVVDRVCGVTPAGFRAPWFSVTAECRWVYEVLEELGLHYSSSVYDSPLLRQRLRPIPAHPFRAGGLWEFPIAVWKGHGVRVPIGGGSYWRALPSAALWQGLERVRRQSLFPVLYFHPYEFAVEDLQVVPPPGATLRERGREASRRRYKNARRRLIPGRIREAATRFHLISFREALGGLEE